MKVLLQVVVGMFLIAQAGYSQHFQGIHGSAYAGSLGTGANPASIVFTPYAWDVTLMGGQYKTLTNAFTTEKYPLFRVDTSGYLMKSGNFKRMANGHFHVHLLNARISMTSRKAIAFGLNLRGYLNGTTSPFGFTDTTSTLRSFFSQNDGLLRANGNIVNSTWLEAFGSYGFTVFDRVASRLHAGVTLKLNKGLAGGYLDFENVSVRADDNVVNDFVIDEATIEFGYSATADELDADKGSGNNFSSLVKDAEIGFSADLGIEYVIKTEEITDVYNDEADYSYVWKFGMSLLDLGWSNYRYSANSRSIAHPLPGVNSTRLTNAFNGISTFPEFNDRLDSLVQESDPVTGTFRILHPARLIVNADRHISENFFVNGEVTLPLSSLAGKNRLHVTDMGLVTITPRWETLKWGVYVPFQVSRDGQFMAGLAFKAGPLLLGFHNLGNIVGKNRNVNGGGYLALVIRSRNGAVNGTGRGIDCPVVKY